MCATLGAGYYTNHVSGILLVFWQQEDELVQGKRLANLPICPDAAFSTICVKDDVFLNLLF